MKKDTKKVILKQLLSFFKKYQVIDEEYYLKQNSDVKNSGSNPIDHYFEHGQYEGRQINNKTADTGDFIKFEGLDLELSGNITSFFKDISPKQYSEYLSRSNKSFLKLSNYFSVNSLDATPLISVIVSVFNGERFILENLQSIEEQSYDNFEVIVIDDCSTDDSILKINKFISNANDHTKYNVIKNKKNVGLACSLKIAMKNCNGEFITFLEQDDLFHIDSLSQKSLLLHDNPGADLIVGYTEPFGDISICLQKKEYLSKSRIRLASEKTHIFNHELYHTNYIPSFSSVMVRSKLFKSLNFNVNHQKLDWFLWAQILKTKPLYIAPESVTYWRQHVDSLSSDTNKHLATRVSFKKSLSKVLGVDGDKIDPNVNDIEKSIFFDRYWYSDTYDVLLGSAASHYLYEGWLVGNDPSISFSTRDYLIFHKDVKDAKINPLLHFIKHSNISNPRETIAREVGLYPCDIVFITTTTYDGAVFEYRMKGLFDRFNLNNVNVLFDSLHNPKNDIVSHIKNSKVLIFNRPLSSGKSANIIRYAKECGCTLIADFDDLISDDMFYVNGRYLSLDEKESVINDTEKQIGVLPYFDFLSVSTAPLKEHFAKYFNGEIFVLNNKIRKEFNYHEMQMVKASEAIKVGIFSGSPTHDHDIGTVLWELLVAKHQFQFDLYIGGKSDLASHHKEFTQLPFLPYEDMLNQMGKFDLIICPLAFNLFNMCKSNIRFLEAGISAVPILAP